MRSLYPYHNAALVPNKYVSVRVCLFVCCLFASELISSPKLGAGLRYCPSVDLGHPRGQNRPRRDRAIPFRKFCGDLIEPYRSLVPEERVGRDCEAVKSGSCVVR